MNNINRTKNKISMFYNKFIDDYKLFIFLS